MREVWYTYKTSEKKTKLFLRKIFIRLSKNELLKEDRVLWGRCGQSNSSCNFSIERLSRCHMRERDIYSKARHLSFVSSLFKNYSDNKNYFNFYWIQLLNNLKLRIEQVIFVLIISSSSVFG